MTVLSVAAAIAAADTGPLVTAEIYQLSNVGKVRVTYNWLYSALNCDPGDPSGLPGCSSRRRLSTCPVIARIDRGRSRGCLRRQPTPE